jgi:signal transduction histidine kinase
MSAGSKAPQLERAPDGTPTTLEKLVTLGVHEFRSPLSVVSGYLRMLLTDRAGPLQDHQRRILEEMEKSCARLSGLLVEVRELSRLEDGTAPFNRSAIDLRRILDEVVAELPQLADRPITIDVAGESARVHGDVVRLKAAFASLLFALGRELVTSDRIAVRIRRAAPAALTITIGEEARIEHLLQSQSSDLETFNEWERGGVGLSLPTARRIIEAHGGHLWGIREDSKAAAFISLPALTD